MRKIIGLFSFILLSLIVTAQEKSIRGTVTKNDGTPVPFASIVVEGYPQSGSSSDDEGKFEIKVPQGSTQLKVSAIGYLTVTVPITGAIIQVSLTEDKTDMGEVVVVGYGKQKKITSLGAIASVSGQELRQSPAASLQNALVGRLPGVFQLQTSGQPGSDAANIYLRGISTYVGGGAAQQPLVIIDNVEGSISQLTQLDANEVESLSILTDASSTAIYGVKGANGVIIVTTRKGKLGKPVITFSTEAGLQVPTVRRKPLGSYQSLSLLKEYLANTGSNPAAVDPRLYSDSALEHFRLGDDPYHYPDVNWYDALVKKNTLIQRNNVNISGGTQDVKYFVSLGYLFQNGILQDVPKQEDFNNNYYLKRYSLRSNIDASLYKDLTLSLNFSGRFNEINSPYLPDIASGGAWPMWRRISSGLLMPWIYPIKNDDGSYGGNSTLQFPTLNPVGILEYAGYNRTYSNNLNLNLTAVHKLDFITRGLSLTGMLAYSSDFGFTRNLQRPSKYFPEYEYVGTTDELTPVFPDLLRLPPFTVSTSSSFPAKLLNPQLILNYTRKFGDHNVSAMAVYNRQTRVEEQAPNTNIPITTNFKGYSARLNYDFRSKYILELTGGYNGSDRFSAAKRYGFFPAGGIGWIISEEKFFKEHVQFINFLKIRSTLGTLGNDGIRGTSGQYLYQDVYSRSTGAYYFGEVPTSWARIIPGRLPNTDVTWEKERKFDLMLDLKVLNNKLALTLDYFKNKRYDILTTRSTVPAYTGFTLPMVNLGMVGNQGLEVTVDYKDDFGKSGYYFIKGNLSIAKNKILYMDEPPNSANPLVMQTGRPIGQLFGYTALGFYKDSADIASSPKDFRNVQPGDLKYADINGDGVVDTKDQGPIGYPLIPQLTYGISWGISYKGIDISALIQGAGRSSIMSNTMLQIGTVNAAPTAIHLKRWTPETAATAEFPRLGGPDFDNSTFWLRPASYTRLKNVEIGYHVPQSFVNRIGLGLNDIRLYANGQNLITWFNLKIYDIDPESDRGDGQVSAYSNYPQQKIFNFGLQLTFK